MAQVAAPGSPASPASPASAAPYAQQNAPRGTKRAADSSLDNEQRLSKRFDLLNLVDSNGARLYIPIPGSTDATLPRPPASPTSCPDPLAFVPPAKPTRDGKPRAPGAHEAMQVEDTPHRVYISDLSAELSDMESDEENPIFLPDIERHLSKIPRHLLLGPEPTPTEHNQVVLYNVPASLTLPEAQDNVRKAIVEARQRIRDKQVNPNTEPATVDDDDDDMANGTVGTKPIIMGHQIAPMQQEQQQGYEDAMDID